MGSVSYIAALSDPWILRPTWVFEWIPVGSFINLDRSWNRDRLSHCFRPNDTISIVSISLSRPYHRDELYWYYDNKSHYPVRSGYRLALNLSRKFDSGSSVICPRWKFIWDLSLPNKIKIFLWCACSRMLFSLLRLRMKGAKVDDICPFCRWSEESSSHLFLLGVCP